MAPRSCIKVNSMIFTKKRDPPKTKVKSLITRKLEIKVIKFIIFLRCKHIQKGDPLLSFFSGLVSVLLTQKEKFVVQSTCAAFVRYHAIIGSIVRINSSNQNVARSPEIEEKKISLLS